MPVPSVATLASRTSTLPSSPHVHRFSVRRKHPANHDLVSSRLIPLVQLKEPADDYPSQPIDIFSDLVKHHTKEELDIMRQKATEEIAAVQRHELPAAAAAVTITRKSSLFSNLEHYEDEDLDHDINDLIHTGRTFSRFSDDLSEDQSWSDEEDSTRSQEAMLPSTTTTPRSSRMSSTVKTDLNSLTHEALEDYQYQCDEDAKSAYRAHRTQSYVHTMSSSAWWATPSPSDSSLTDKTDNHRMTEEMLQNHYQLGLAAERRAISRAIKSRSRLHTTSSPTPSISRAPSTSFLAEEDFLLYLRRIDAKQDRMMMVAQCNWPICKHQQTLLSIQQALLQEQQTLIDDQKAMIADQQALLADQKTLLADQQTLLADQQTLLSNQETTTRSLQSHQEWSPVIESPMLAPPSSANSTGPSTRAPTRAPTPSRNCNNHRAPRHPRCQPLLTTQEIVISSLANQQDLDLVIDPGMLAPPPSANSTCAPTRAPTPTLADNDDDQQALPSWSFSTRLPYRPRVRV
ncbi:hypothetical protein ASPACDRAFT_1859056 [Aspergillus aculeatus ATCC 16872]|uniref:Uncharacterized protein n=1 Tax=Aspergillus aculeatus (strain ATCC 16872 / CBS 172.66 / WB 5094) TaxID=690307 RepID=A0A1L9WLF4_ASPA1|nr:uncharacterized protein ASPACDRAFT_1859056 [Aspergillus aculeatus ATCC 16872]OJJ96993.1 hypothetical protein ASPACDRAFT_1859056 [Aspergillus aculeatus ATCC 16872]